MPVDLTPCRCPVCTWLDTPADKRVSERHMIMGLPKREHPAVREQRQREDAEREQRFSKWLKQFEEQDRRGSSWSRE